MCTVIYNCGIQFTQLMIITVEPLYCGHHWEKPKCPDWRGVPHFIGTCSFVH